MSSKREVAHRLAATKTALAEKCDRLAMLSGSKPKRETLTRQAAKFRRAAADLLRK